MKKSKSTFKKTTMPREFLQWWEPWGIDKATGASIGGHPDAERMWARPEPEGGYTRRKYGITAKLANRDLVYRTQFNEWKDLGSPSRDDYVSMAAPLAKQREFWHDIAPILAMIGAEPAMKDRIRQEYKTDELIPKLLEKYAPA